MKSFYVLHLFWFLWIGTLPRVTRSFLCLHNMIKQQQKSIVNSSQRSNQNEFVLLFDTYSFIYSTRFKCGWSKVCGETFLFPKKQTPKKTTGSISKYNLILTKFLLGKFVVNPLLLLMLIKIFVIHFHGSKRKR